VSLSVSALAKYYDHGLFPHHLRSIGRLADDPRTERENISISITLTLLFRSVGAIIFGLAGDLYGRKWPMVRRYRGAAVRCALTRARSLIC